MFKDMNTVAGKAWEIGAVRWTLWGMAALAISCQAALAKPTTLICNNANGTFTIDIDEARHTVTMNDARNLGTVAAVFNSKKITFTEVQAPGGDPQNNWNYTIDRLTGIVSMITDPGLRFPNLFTCHVGKSQF